MIVPSAILCLALFATSTHAAIFNSKAVKQLTTKNFQSTIKNSNKLTLAAFVAPWCGHCQKLAPEYDKAAENLKGLVNLVAVDCDEEPNKQLCGEMGIQGFPTLKLFPGGSAPSQTYEGPRTASGIVDYVKGHMPNFVKRATTGAEVEALRVKSSEKPVTLLFTSAAVVTPLYKALSAEFHKYVDFYAARESKVGQEAMAAFGVEKVPALIVIVNGEVTKYEGKLNYVDLDAFVRPFAKAAKAAKTKAAKKDEL